MPAFPEVVGEESPLRSCVSQAIAPLSCGLLAVSEAVERSIEFFPGSEMFLGCSALNAWDCWWEAYAPVGPCICYFSCMSPIKDSNVVVVPGFPGC